MSRNEDNAKQVSWIDIRTVIHNYGTPYRKCDIFVGRPLLWLKLEIINHEEILRLMVLNLLLNVDITRTRAVYSIFEGVVADQGLFQQ